jgi:hypothetical protein
MVRTEAPSKDWAELMQVWLASDVPSGCSRMTTQALHWPMPQPNLVPVRLRYSRR